eukprot:205191_1
MSLSPLFNFASCPGFSVYASVAEMSTLKPLTIHDQIWYTIVDPADNNTFDCLRIYEPKNESHQSVQIPILVKQQLNANTINWVHSKEHINFFQFDPQRQLNHVIKFNINTNKWSQDFANSTKFPSVINGIFNIENEVFFLGANNYTQNPQIYNFKYDLSSNIFQDTEDMIFPNCYGRCEVVYNDKQKQFISLNYSYDNIEDNTLVDLVWFNSSKKREQLHIKTATKPRSIVHDNYLILLGGWFRYRSSNGPSIPSLNIGVLDLTDKYNVFKPLKQLQCPVGFGVVAVEDINIETNTSCLIVGYCRSYNISVPKGVTVLIEEFHGHRYYDIYIHLFGCREGYWHDQVEHFKISFGGLIHALHNDHEHL